MKVAVFGSKNFEREFLKQHPEIPARAQHVSFTYLLPRLDSKTAPLAAGADAVVVFANDSLDEKTLSVIAKTGTRCVILRCTGYNNVDLVAADKLGITVLHVPHYSPHAIAEFSAALLLTVVRKTHKAYNRTREGNFALRGLTGFDLHGKTVGICGVGSTGRQFAKIMLAFGTRVIAYDVTQKQDVKDMGVEYVSFDELLTQSDILSMHCRLRASTRHIIDSSAVSKMKKGVVLINTSRGELVDMNALLEGLRTHKIGACGMDVVEGEEALFFDDHTGEILANEKVTTLMTLPNVVVTPHIGFCTSTAMEEIWNVTMDNILEFSSRSGNEKLTNQLLLKDL